MLERIAVLCSETGRAATAIQVLTAGRQRLLQVGDAYGAFRLTLRMAQVCLAAAQPTSTEKFFSEAVQGTGPILAENYEYLLRRIEQLGWTGVPAQAVAAGRVDAAMTLARYGAAVGHYGPAIAAANAASRVLPGAEAEFSASQIRLFGAELRLERGDLSADDPDEPAHRDAEDALRWRALQARRALLEGRLSEARVKLESIALSRHLTAPKFESQVTQMRAYVLGLLNRIDDAEALLADLEQRLRGSTGHEAMLGPVRALRTMLQRRLRRQSDELLLPFVPEQAIQAARVSTSNTGRPMHDLDGADDAEGSTLLESQRSRQRFAAEWGLLANRVFLALDDRSLELAQRRLAEVMAFVRTTDSDRILARTGYLRALVAYYSGQFEDAHQLALQCSDKATAARLALDDLQALELLSWTSRRLRRADHAEVTQRAQAAFELVRRGLDDEDRAFYILNRTTQQEQFVTQALDRLLQEPPPVHTGFFRWFHDWRARRAYRQARLRAYAEISYLRHWSVEQLTPSGAAESAPTQQLVRPDHATESSQVQAWVREELRLRRASRGHRRRRHLLERWWPLRAIPPDVAIVDYQVSARKLHVLVLTREALQAFVVPTTRVDLYHAVRQVIVECTKQAKLGTARTHVDAAFVRLSTALGVARTIEPLVGRVQHLVLIPSDILVHTPFAGLVCAGGHWCDHFSTSLVPSLDSLHVEALGTQRPLASKRLLGVSVEYYPGTALGPLTRAAAEVDAVAHAGAFTSVCHLRDEQAAPSAILEQLARSDWAHFACHGTFDREMPHESRLHVGGQPGERHELTLGQLQTSPLGDLQGIVLASCWTSSTAVLPGGELVCLPNALLKAGARQVVAPLWETMDVQSIDFMTAFYTAMRTLPPAAALANVQREWAAQSDREHRVRARPFSWAGYVRYGCG